MNKSNKVEQTTLTLEDKVISKLFGYLEDVKTILVEANKRLGAVLELDKALVDVLSKKTGIFTIAAQGQQSQTQPEKKQDQPAALPEELSDLPGELKDKLVVCPGGVKLQHYYKDDTWQKTNDVLKQKGWFWMKDEKDKKNSHWEKGKS